MLLVWLSLAMAACTDSNKPAEPARWQALATELQFHSLHLCR